MARRLLVLAWIAALSSQLACTQPANTMDQSIPATPAETPDFSAPIETGLPTSPEGFRQRLLDSALRYETWGRVDDEARWAPPDCRSPMPGRAIFSESSDTESHGRKLYSLFAKNRWAYLAQSGNNAPSPFGQIVVKESWVPEEVKDGERKHTVEKAIKPLRHEPIDPYAAKDSFEPFAEKDGKLFKATKLAGLFVMMKLDPTTPDTDDGWVYGTVSADLKTVTAVGKIESCMECHVKAKADRLFGLKSADGSVRR